MICAWPSVRPAHRQCRRSPGLAIAGTATTCRMGRDLSPIGQHGGMPAAAHEDPPRVRSWITPKAAKGGASAIEGRGVHAVEAIAGGEVVAVKGGHIVDGSAV